MKFLIKKIFFILVAFVLLLFALSNQSTIALSLWPFVGSLNAPLFLVVLVVFVCAFFMGVVYSRIMRNT